MSLISRSVVVRAPVETVWPIVVDWPRHGDWVPLTTVRVLTPEARGVGVRFVGRTALPGPAGRIGFDDVMEVVEWREPGATARGRCTVVKLGRLLGGRAWFEVAAEPGGRSRVTWSEDVEPVPLRPLRRRLAAGVGPGVRGVVNRSVDRAAGAGLNLVLARMARDIEAGARGNPTTPGEG